MSPPDADNSQSGTTKPVLRLVRGSATPEELAAVVAILAARSGGSEQQEQVPPPSQWVSRANLLRRPLSPGRGAWSASAFRQ